jgi:hypothetical protein
VHGSWAWACLGKTTLDLLLPWVQKWRYCTTSILSPDVPLLTHRALLAKAYGVPEEDALLRCPVWSPDTEHVQHHNVTHFLANFQVINPRFCCLPFPVAFGSTQGMLSLVCQQPVVTAPPFALQRWHMSQPAA